MKTYIMLRAQGEWWEVTLPNADALKAILNCGSHNGTKVYAIMLHIGNVPLIYDFEDRTWK